MIDPSKVKDAFKRVENENYSFRSYLKINADIDKLDEQFLELHNELFKNYDCSKCRNCCKAYTTSFETEELDSVAMFLNITKHDFINKYIDEIDDEYQLKVKPCCFLNEDGGCHIEECKPASCRDYPFTNKPKRLFSLLSILDSAEVCPVVFEMFERLKKTYCFRRKR